MMSGLFKKNDSKIYDDFFKNLSRLTKETRNRSQITGNTHRLIFQRQKGKFSLYVENASKKITPGSFEDRFEAQKEDSKKDPEAPAPQFTPTTRLTPKSISFPLDIKLDEIHFSGLSEAVKEDYKVPIYFFPEGLMESVALHFSARDGQLKWTLFSMSLTGRLIRIDGHKDLKEIESELQSKP